jgi:hypothetical protein
MTWQVKGVCLYSRPARVRAKQCDTGLKLAVVIPLIDEEPRLSVCLDYLNCRGKCQECLMSAYMHVDPATPYL